MQPQPVNTQTQRILVVDDSPTSLRVAVTALRDRGFEVCTATDGEQAIQVALELKPEVVVLDIILPKKNGYQVCRELKSDPASKGIKVLLLSSKSNDSDKYWGQRQGADAYVTKPFEDEELANAVGALLSCEPSSTGVFFGADGNSPAIEKGITQ